MQKTQTLSLVKQKAVFKIKKVPLLLKLSLISPKNILTYVFYILLNFLKVPSQSINVSRINELYKM